MGMGDEILVAGEARRLQEADPAGRRVGVYSFHGQPRWSPLWANNPRIIAPEELFHRKPDHIRLVNGPRCRPYIDYGRMKREFAAVFPGDPWNPKKRTAQLPWRFTDWRVSRGELYCVQRKKPGDYIVVEPHFKPNQPNRDWGWECWQAVVDALGLDWVQINPPGARLLDGVRHAPADSFIAACRLISGAACYLGPEGGLYHAAAALGVPAVAIFGGYISPANQGYDDCVNLYETMDGESPCGQRVPCEHCRAAMAGIRPEIVADHVEQMMNRRTAA